MCEEEFWDKEQEYLRGIFDTGPVRASYSSKEILLGEKMRHHCLALGFFVGDFEEKDLRDGVMIFDWPGGETIRFVIFKRSKGSGIFGKPNYSFRTWFFYRPTARIGMKDENRKLAKIQGEPFPDRRLISGALMDVVIFHKELRKQGITKSIAQRF